MQIEKASFVIAIFAVLGVCGLFYIVLTLFVRNWPSSMTIVVVPFSKRGPVHCDIWLFAMLMEATRGLFGTFAAVEHDGTRIRHFRPGAQAIGDWFLA